MLQIESSWYNITCREQMEVKGNINLMFRLSVIVSHLTITSRSSWRDPSSQQQITITE